MSYSSGIFNLETSLSQKSNLNSNWSLNWKRKEKKKKQKENYALGPPRLISAQDWHTHARAQHRCFG